MSSIDSIYNELFAGKTMRVRCGTKSLFETLRTGLCRKNSQYVALDLSTQSVLAKFDEHTGIGEFVLGDSKRRTKASRWEILSEPENGHNGNDPETS